MTGDTWLQKYWRPMMAVSYMIVILFDFIIAPILWSFLQYYAMGTVTLQWAPLTLLSGGILHAAMGAVIGISAFSRGREKIEEMKLVYETNTANGKINTETNNT